MGKLIAEKLALRKYADVEQLYRITMRTVILFGLVLFFVTWFGAPLYGSLTALKESHQARDALTMSIRALAPALLVVPLESALRGYMKVFKKLEPSAYSQAVEQLFRVATIVIGADLVMSAGGSVAAGAAAATLGGVCGGALAGVILLIFSVIPLRRRFLVRVAKQQAQLTQREALRTLMKYALPVSLGSPWSPYQAWSTH